jgi:hypothetical protein
MIASYRMSISGCQIECINGLVCGHVSRRKNRALQCVAIPQSFSPAVVSNRVLVNLNDLAVSQEPEIELAHSASLRMTGLYF